MGWLIRKIARAIESLRGRPTMKDREAESFHTIKDGKATGDVAPWHEDD